MADWGEALISEGPERQKKLEAATEALREELEQLATKVVALALVQPPASLLGYIWAQVFVGRMRAGTEKNSTEAPSFELFQFALEYLHAIWSGNVGPFGQGKLDEAKANELLSVFGEFRTKTGQFCMVSSVANTANATELQSDLDFQAKSTWVLIRGHRHQVLEGEFFKFVLSPHDDAFREAYGVGAIEIAEGMQRIANAFRAGHANAATILKEYQEHTVEFAQKNAISIEDAIKRIDEENPTFGEQFRDAMTDLFQGGICNVSRHSKLPASILEDMGYEPGGELEFFEAGPFAGTPFRTLPARIRPLVRLDGNFYATDGQFVRDSAYRAIQRGVINRNNAYRETWNSRQKKLTEGAFGIILKSQLEAATIYNDVYFRDVATGQWVETDTVGAVDDILFVIEAKPALFIIEERRIAPR